MSDRTDRSERLRRRFDRPASADGEAPGDSSDDPADGATATPTPSDATDPANGGSVKERPSTLMYLPDGIDRDLDLTFDEVNLRYRRAFDEKLEKNRDYYPLVAVHGLRTLQEWDAAAVREALSELRE